MPLAAPLALGAAEDIVGGHADEAGDDLGKSEGFAVALLARVSGEQLDRVISDLSGCVDLELEGGREAFERGIAGLAANNQRNDRAVRMPRLKESDLLVDVVALC